MAYRFEDCSLAAERRELRRAGAIVRTEPQVLDLLLFLVRNRDRVVDRDEIVAAVWQGRIISDSTIASRIAAARRAVGDDGVRQRLIRTHARRGFRFVGEVREEGVRAPADDKPAGAGDGPPDAPVRGIVVPITLGGAAISVRRFRNITGRISEDRLAAAIAEEIAAGLCHLPWLSVVDRGEDTSANEWMVEIREGAAGTGIHYVLLGSLGRSASRIRLIARLVDVATRRILWSERFGAEADDLLCLQEIISTRVVDAIAARLERVEIERARKSGDETDSRRHYLRGLGRLYEWSRDGIRDARVEFDRAADLDPDFAAAYAMAAYCFVQRKSYGWVDHVEQDRAECERLARHAAELGAQDPVSQTRAAHAIASVAHDIDSGAIFVERALRLNPGFAGAWYVLGWIRLFLGQPELAGEHLTRALALGPCDPMRFKMQAALAYALFLSGRHDEAAALAARSLSARPTYLTGVRVAAASHVYAGRLDEARALVARMRRIDARLRVATLPTLIPFRRAEDLDRWSDALRRAGLPE